MTKLKMIASLEAKVGLRVVVSEHVNTQLYEIKTISKNSRAVELAYKLDTPDKRLVDGGWMPRDACYHPSAAQLRANGL